MNTLDSLFSWFTATTLRGSMLAIGVLALHAALRGRMPARWKYLIWLPVVMVLMSPGLPESRWSLENLFLRDSSRIVRVASPAPVITDRVESTHSTDSVVSSFPAQTTRLDWRQFAAQAWLAGAIGMLCFSITAYVRTMRRMRLGEVPVSTPVATLLAEVTAASGTARTVRVLMSHAVESPAVAGVLRPTLLLPAGFPAGVFTPDEARLVLLHEMAHLRRYDLPVNWLLSLLQAIHWCNPVLWFAFARIRADRESACDEAVLASTARDCRSDYGHALLKLESALGQSGMNLGFLGIFERAAGVHARMKAIAHYRPAHPAWAALSVALIFAMSAVGATRAQNPAPRLPSSEGVAGSPAKTPVPGVDANPQRDQAAQNLADDPKQKILRKLKTIIIPRIDFREASVIEAVDFLKRKSVELDKAEPDPAKRGVNIVLKLPSMPGQLGVQAVPGIPGLPATPAAPGVAAAAPGVAAASDPTEIRLTISLSNIPLGEALKYVTSLAGLKYKVESYAISVVPLVAQDALVTREWEVGNGLAAALGEKEVLDPKKTLTAKGISFPPGSYVVWVALAHRLVMKNTEDNLDMVDALLAPRAMPRATPQPSGTSSPMPDAQRKALSIIIPRLEFREAALPEAIDFVRKKAIALDPDGVGVNIVVALANQDIAKDARITVSLANIPVWEALRYITNLGNVNLTAQPNGLRIQSGNGVKDTASPAR